MQAKGYAAALFDDTLLYTSAKCTNEFVSATHKLPPGFTQGVVCDELAKLGALHQLVFVQTPFALATLPSINNGRRLTRLNYGVLGSQLNAEISTVTDTDALAGYVRFKYTPEDGELLPTGIMMINNRRKDGIASGGHVRWLLLDSTTLKEVTVTFMGNDKPGPLLLEPQSALSQCPLIVANLAERFAQLHPDIATVAVWADGPYATNRSVPFDQVCKLPYGTQLNRLPFGYETVLIGGIFLAAGHHLLKE